MSYRYTDVPQCPTDIQMSYRQTECPRQTEWPANILISYKLTISYRQTVSYRHTDVLIQTVSYRQTQCPTDILLTYMQTRCPTDIQMSQRHTDVLQSYRCPEDIIQMSYGHTNVPQRVPYIHTDVPQTVSYRHTDVQQTNCILMTYYALQANSDQQIILQTNSVPQTKRCSTDKLYCNNIFMPYRQTVTHRCPTDIQRSYSVLQIYRISKDRVSYRHINELKIQVMSLPGNFKLSQITN